MLKYKVFRYIHIIFIILRYEIGGEIGGGRNQR
jgi:hypothetical protein